MRFYISSLKYYFLLVQLNQSAQKFASARKHVFESDRRLAGKELKTYALCVGIGGFEITLISIFLPVK